MSLFNRKKNTKTASAAPVENKASPKPVFVADTVLIRPRITEKAAILAAHNAYAFEVKTGASKAAVVSAIKTLYKVTPVDVRFVSIKPKRVFVRGKMGQKAGGRKAYVYLKKGDKIEIV